MATLAPGHGSLGVAQEFGSLSSGRKGLRSSAPLAVWRRRGEGSRKLPPVQCSAPVNSTAKGTVHLSLSLSLALRGLDEVHEVFTRIGELSVEGGPSPFGDPFATLVGEILDAKSGRIVLYGVGREGLMMRALAMRLFHLGLDASVVGDMSAPHVGEGDLFIASAGPGRFSTVNSLLRVAKSAGARTVVVTAQPRGSAPKMADAIVWLPAKTMADDTKNLSKDGAEPETVLPMGSVYEGTLFLFFEVVVKTLRDALGETAETMRARHTNLE